MRGHNRLTSTPRMRAAQLDDCVLFEATVQEPITPRRGCSLDRSAGAKAQPTLSLEIITTAAWYYK